MPGIMSEGSGSLSSPSCGAQWWRRCERRVLGIGGDREQRFGRRAEQEIVNHRLVLIGDRRDLGGQCEHHVEIADRQQIGLAGRKPILRRRALTLWAMAVTTRVVSDAAVAAILATLDMAAECR